MANEIQLTGALAFNKPNVTSGPVGKSLVNTPFSVAGTTYSQGSMAAPITPTPIPLGQMTQPHWAFLQNNDAVNYVTVFNGASGAVLLRLYPGEGCPIPLDPTCVPYVQANTAAAEFEYLIISL